MRSQLLTDDALARLHNRALADYAAQYKAIADSFEKSVSSFGLPFDKADADRRANETETLRSQLKSLGTICFYNDGKSLVYGRKSAACHACEKGQETATFYISFKCTRHCWFCFNPNQDGFDYYSRHLNDWRGELAELKASGAPVKHIALTGGEPLLHKGMTLAFFRQVQKDFPGVHTRLYTAGDLLDQDCLVGLRQAGLREIRFSIKLDDPPEIRRRIWDKIALAKTYIPDVLVEMPVIPGTLDEMKRILDRLQQLGVFGINLLEFCFPLNNAAEFAKRELKIKYPPYPVLYNYWYAGGLPIAGSEPDCLRLLKYAADKQMTLNVHYCSLANKYTGQIYRQNASQKVDDNTLFFSPRDFYYKAIKIFPPDAQRALAVLKNMNTDRYRMDGQALQIHPSLFKLFEGVVGEAGLSWFVCEARPDGTVIRELRIDRVTPETFDPDAL